MRFYYVKLSCPDHDDEFNSAVHRIITMPTTKWEHYSEELDIRRARRITSKEVRQIASRNARVKLAETHPLYDTLYCMYDIEVVDNDYVRESERE